MRRLILLAFLVVGCTAEAAPTYQPAGPAATSWGQAIEHGLGMDRTPVSWGNEWCTGLVAFQQVALGVIQFGKDLAIPNVAAARDDGHQIVHFAEATTSNLKYVPTSSLGGPIATAYTKTATDATAMVTTFFAYLKSHAANDLKAVHAAISVVSASATAATKIPIPDGFKLGVVCL